MEDVRTKDILTGYLLKVMVGSFNEVVIIFIIIRTIRIKSTVQQEL